MNISETLMGLLLRGKERSTSVIMSTANKQNISQINPLPIQLGSITVEKLYVDMRERLRLQLISGANGFGNLITDKGINKPGLALAGFVGVFTYHQVQVLDDTEMYFLRSHKPEERLKAFSLLASFAIPCIIITEGNKIDNELQNICDERKIPLFETKFNSTKAISLLSDYLEYQFDSSSPTTQSEESDSLQVKQVILDLADVLESNPSRLLKNAFSRLSICIVIDRFA